MLARRRFNEFVSSPEYKASIPDRNNGGKYADNLEILDFFSLNFSLELESGCSFSGSFSEPHAEKETNQLGPKRVLCLCDIFVSQGRHELQYKV